MGRSKKAQATTARGVTFYSYQFLIEFRDGVAEPTQVIASQDPKSPLSANGLTRDAATQDTLNASRRILTRRD
ncbi:hypothetical protein HK405_000576 [Cladochytrium tenue]|nr:hypothetical protein HK405_000576 [Cladochytrium tenue]